MITNDIKKLLKDWAKRDAKKKAANMLNIDGLLIHKENGDYDHEQHTFLMAAGTAKEALDKLSNDFPVYGMDAPRSAYDCTGRPFCDPAKIREVAPERFIVNLGISYDV